MWSGSVGVQDCASAPEGSALRIAVMSYHRGFGAGMTTIIGGSQSLLVLFCFFSLRAHDLFPPLPCPALHYIALH